METYRRYVEVEVEDEDAAYQDIDDKIAEGKIDLHCDGEDYKYDRELFVSEVKEENEQLEEKVMNEKGWTIVFTSWDDCKEKVAGRFKTDKEKDEFLQEIRKPDSGWTDEEIESVCPINDYWYMLPV